MNDVIDFYYLITKQLWSLIVSNWILSVSVLITILGYIITIVNSSRSQR